MWTEEKLKEAAREWENKWYQQHLEDILCGKKIPTRNDAFLAGCKYIINNTQKDGKTDEDNGEIPRQGEG